MNINDSDLKYYVPFKDIELNIDALTIHIKKIYILDDFSGTETNISNKNICYVKYSGEESTSNIDTIYFNLIDTSKENGFKKKQLIDIDIEKKPLSDIIKNIGSKSILENNLILKDNNGSFYFINKGDTQDDNLSISNKFLEEFKKFIQKKLEDFKNCNCFKDNSENQNFDGSKNHFSTDI